MVLEHPTTYFPQARDIPIPKEPPSAGRTTKANLKPATTGPSTLPKQRFVLFLGRIGNHERAGCDATMAEIGTHSFSYGPVRVDAGSTRLSCCFCVQCELLPGVESRSTMLRSSFRRNETRRGCHRRSPLNDDLMELYSWKGMLCNPIMGLIQLLLLVQTTHPQPVYLSRVTNQEKSESSVSVTNSSGPGSENSQGHGPFLSISTPT